MILINLVQRVERTCRKCGLGYTPSHNQSHKRGNICNACHAKAIREWNAKNPEKAKAARDRRWARVQYRMQNNERRKVNFRATKYGITWEMYQALIAAQGGVCSICRKPLPEGENFAVDHNHNTNALRDLLCRKCNSIIGFANDSIEVLTSAIEYLQRHAESPRSFIITPRKNWREAKALEPRLENL